MLTLTPFDTSTEGGRSLERYRRAALTTTAAAVAKGVAVVTTLISVPLTVGYLGTERYGLWMTISSVIAMLSFADLGIGNGLMNAISEANGKEDHDAAHRYVSSGFFLLLGTAAVVLAAFSSAYLFIPWGRLFNVTSVLALRESGPAMAVFVASFALNMPLGVVQRVQTGYQEGFRSNLWQSAGSLLGLAGVLVAIALRAGLPWLVLAMSGGPVLAALINTTVEFWRTRPWLCPSLSSFCMESSRRLFGVGIMFVALQLAGAIAFASDNLVVAQILGPSAVTHYAIPMRLFAIVGIVPLMLFSPLWPAYGEAVARRDIAWVTRALIRSLWITLLLCCLPAIVLVLAGKPIIALWVGPQIQPSFALLLGMGLWTILTCMGGTLAMFLNGAGVIRFQVICAILMAGSALALKILLARWIGLPGIVWGTVFAYAVFSALPSVIYIPRLLEKMRS